MLLELLGICEKKKYGLQFEEVLEKISASLNYPVFPLNLPLALECSRIKGIKDVHDRVLLATARTLGAILITKDSEIKKAGLVKTVW